MEEEEERGRQEDRRQRHASVHRQLVIHLPLSDVVEYITSSGKCAVRGEKTGPVR